MVDAHSDDTQQNLISDEVVWSHPQVKEQGDMKQTSGISNLHQKALHYK